jgi:flagellar L-ring protein precursor FlgH
MKYSPSVLSMTLFSLVIFFSGCDMIDKISEVGSPPRVSSITDPTKAPGYKEISMPMPAPSLPPRGTNSLWRPGARAFFKDQRATDIGDIVTVAVNINESGALSNNTSTSTANSEAANPGFTFFGLESTLAKLGMSSSNLFSFGSNSSVSSKGAIGRKEQVIINLAATVIQKLPNGNLVISGKQELRINGELRELSVAGIIRAEDISTLDTIASDKIAEARITYGGRGTLADVQTPRYGQQLFDAIAPF